MKEIMLENNPLGIKLYVNGRPSINNMNKEEYEIFVSSLELMMSEYYENIRTEYRVKQ